MCLPCLQNGDRYHETYMYFVGWELKHAADFKDRKRQAEGDSRTCEKPGKKEIVGMYQLACMCTGMNIHPELQSVIKVYAPHLSIQW